MKSGSPPPAPDPQKTAQAQAKANQQTATTQQQLNMVDQTTPYGALTHEQTGTWDDGTPKFAATTTLSPEQQALLEQQNRFGGLVNELGISQAERLTGHLDEPVNLSNAGIEDAIMSRYMPRFEEREAEGRDRLETMLVNKGLRPGTEAYDREVRNFRRSQGDSFNQLMLDARGRSVDEMLTARNQPINEITALMSGGQVTQPNFRGTPQAGVSGTDVAGLTMDAYRYGPLAQYQADQANKRALMGGLSSLGSAAISGWAMSDSRLKEGSKKVGRLDDGTKIYAYRYKGHPMMQLGVMAQEVEKSHPEAVAETDTGFMAVNYSRIAEDMAA